MVSIQHNFYPDKEKKIHLICFKVDGEREREREREREVQADRQTDRQIGLNIFY